jgi:hypothetical protein
MAHKGVFSLCSAEFSHFVRLTFGKAILQANVDISAEMGAPRKVIDEVEVTRLRMAHTKWTAIAKQLGVAKRTLERWRIEVGYTEPFQPMTDDELDDFVASNVGRYRGLTMMQGLIRSASYNVTRERLRASMTRVDAIGIAMRKQKRIARRVYVSAGPHNCWHIDGHHKLVRFGLVTHGCIDGFSRAVMYLRCCNNNKSTTTLRLFKDATRRFMTPKHVRGDKGGENVLIADEMILRRGLGVRAFKVGSSKHNTRIERLWRDVHTDRTQYYKDMFMQLEEEGMDVDNKLHIFLLQYMFLNRINEDLDVFKGAWNSHPIRTEHNKSPYSLLTDHVNLYPTAVPEPEPYNYEPQEIPGEGPPQVHVEPPACPMSEEQYEYFSARCHPLTLADEQHTLCDKFMSALEFAYQVMQVL